MSIISADAKENSVDVAVASVLLELDGIFPEE